MSRRPAIDPVVTVVPAARGTLTRGTLARAAWLAVAATLLASGPLLAAWPLAVQGPNIGLEDDGYLSTLIEVTEPVTAVGADGSVYLAGTFQGTATFGAQVSKTSTGGSIDVYVAKYDELGDLQWVLTSSGSGTETLADLELDAAGDLYLTGSFDASVQFGGIPAFSPVSNLDGSAVPPVDIFVAKVGDLGDGGAWQWAHAWGTRKYTNVGQFRATGLDYPSGLAIDELSERVLVIGTAEGTRGTSNGAACSNHPESVIIPVPLDGGSPDPPVWLDGISGGWGNNRCQEPPDTEGQEVSYGQAITARDGNVFVAGRTESDTAYQIYLRKYESGSLVFDGQQWEATVRADFAYSALDVITDDAQGVYVAGGRDVRGTAPMAPTSAFAAKYTDNFNPTPTTNWDTGDLSDPPFFQLALSGATGELFALGTNNGNTRIFSIDRGTGDTAVLAATGGGTATGRSMATDGETRLYVAGLFEGTVFFGGESLTADDPDRHAFLNYVDVGGNWPGTRIFDVGQPIQRPEGADPGVEPTPQIDGVADPASHFYWDGTNYYPVRDTPAATTVLLLWQKSNPPNPPNSPPPPSLLEQFSVAEWPADPQLHAAGADVALSSASHTFQELHYSQGPEGGTSSADAGVFRRAAAGFSTLRYEEVSSGNTAFEVVESVAFADLGPATESDAEIGIEIPPLPGHDRTDNAFVASSRPPIDAFGPERAFDLASRSGQILPVNVNGAAFDQQLAVVRYAESAATGVRWPDDPYLYNPVWPAAPLKIEIKDQDGSEGGGQPMLVPSVFVSPRIYVQGDPDQPGFNPNDEHALLAPSNPLKLNTGHQAAFALREQATTASAPYVLLKYRDPADGLRFKLTVYQVQASGTGVFDFDVVAGQPIPAPYPLALFGDCPETFAADVSGSPFFQDVRGGVHARADGVMDVSYWYPLAVDFYYDPNDDDRDTGVAGQCVPFLDEEEVRYNVAWPPDPPTLFVGETLVEPKRELPDILGQAAVMVAFQGDTSTPSEVVDAAAMVKLFDALSPRWVDVGVTSTFPVSTLDRAPFYLKVRLEHDPVSVPNRLAFKGYLDNTVLGDDPLLLINVMSDDERNVLLGLSSDPGWQSAISDLHDLSRDPLRLSAVPGELTIGLADVADDGVAPFEDRRLLGAQGALSASAARNTGYVTLAFNNDASLDPASITLKVVRVACAAGDTLYQGTVHTMPTDNVFDERLTLRHSGQPALDPTVPERYAFDWYHQPDASGMPMDVPGDAGATWSSLPESTGAVDVTLQGANERTISDGWVLVRYTDSVGVCSPSLFTAPELAEGWIKRVIRGLDPFRARTADFHAAPTATYATMLEQAGEPYAGPIAFNGDPANVNQLGLIETYETVLRRGIDLALGGNLSTEAATAANTALLLAAGRIADLTMLLANEAWADAQDPTIGFGTQSGVYGNLAPSIFAFQNQLPDLLDEELTLLRGRDGSGAAVDLHPVFNRLIWNIETGDVGEAAYSQVYDVRDRDADGFIDAADARIQYPQGHGDAWGHYTSALKGYYRLLRDENYTWTPRAEAVNVLGAPVTVDYRDERKFAAAAAARAGTGAEVAALTYRGAYVEDPAGQWQGYKDPDPEQAWGLSGWARRAGHGAYLDWVTANALLPDEWQQPGAADCPLADDLDPFLGTECIDVPGAGSFPEVGKIDRAGVPEIDEITQHYGEIQAVLDRADAGLNPLGLARGVVPFDIDPSRVDPGPGVNQGKTHFEQIQERAREALSGAVTVFDHANQLTETLRRNQDTLVDFSRNVEDRERDLRNRLIEIFGYPYADDIGGAGTYPPGYDDADLYHYMVVDPSELIGEPPGPTETVTAFFEAIPEIGYFPGDEREGVELPPTITVDYAYDPAGIGLVKPASWTGSRKAPGELQRALSEYYQAINAFEQALAAYDTLLFDIDSAVEVLGAQYDLNAAAVSALGIGKTQRLNVKILALHTSSLALRRVGEYARQMGEVTAEALPTVAGTSVDATAPQRSLIRLAGTQQGQFADIAADAVDAAELRLEQIKEEANAQFDLDLRIASDNFEVVQRVEALEQLIRREPGLLLEVFNRREAIRQALGNFQQTLARGLRLLDELTAFRARTAADVQQYRYQDLAFRVARNDALQKYRAQFDLAARYVYLAATAYDYETNLLGTAGGAGRDFLTDIVRHRSLGELIGGEPQAGSRGLADPLARMGLNFQVLKGQLGFNNPQTETTRFSLRSELLRIDGAAASDDTWREELEKWRVDNLWDLPEFRRFARPFAPQPSGPCTADDRGGCEPALVIGLESNGGQPLSTQVVAGLNYFGHALGAGDSAYDATNFATRVRSVGLWLTGYDTAGLSATPTAYVIPVGEDVLRPPTAGDFTTRHWAVIDQVLPVPFPVGVSSLDDPLFIPINDSLSGVSGNLGDVRRFSSFRAFPDNGAFEPSQTTTNSRLIGRSVWNTRWLIIIPGRTLLNDPDQGLDRFIEGISDVKLFFQTYAYSGN